MIIMVPSPEDIDFYGKDASKATTGQDNVFRMKVDREGYVCGTVTALSKEEAEAYRQDHAPRSSTVKKGRRSR